MEHTEPTTRRSLEEKLDAEYAPAWRPDPDDMLIGEIVDLARLISSYDGVTPYPCVTVRKDDGEDLAWHAFHTVAKTELAKVRPRIGDRIGIKYLGRKETQSGQKVHLYRVASAADRAEFTWAEFAGEEDPESYEGSPAVFDEAEPAAKEDDSIPF